MKREVDAIENLLEKEERIEKTKNKKLDLLRETYCLVEELRNDEKTDDEYNILNFIMYNILELISIEGGNKNG